MLSSPLKIQIVSIKEYSLVAFFSDECAAFSSGEKTKDLLMWAEVCLMDTYYCDSFSLMGHSAL